MTKIAIIGSGSWGSALAHVYEKHFEVLVYSKGSNKSDLKGCTHIFIVIPMQGLSELCKEIKSSVSAEAYLIVCSKGIEIATGCFPSEVVAKYFDKNHIAVLSGPNFADEIRSGMPAVTSLAASSLEIAELLAKELHVKDFKLIPTDELHAVQVFGALKNVLAILAGFARGLGFGENERAALLTQGIKEITNFSKEKSGKKSVCITNPGCIGDVILTCTSSTSRNTKFGIELAKIYQDLSSSESLIALKGTVEGNFTSKALASLDIRYYPILKFSSYLIGDGINDKAGTIKKFGLLIFE